MRIDRPHRRQIGQLYGLIHPRLISLSLVLFFVLAGIATGIMTSGRFEISPSELWRVLFFPDNSVASSVVHQLRLPRVVTGIATGAGLGLAGLLFQRLSRNALGSPEIIGVVSGAALGAVTGIVLFSTYSWGTAASAVIGCLVATVVGYVLSGGSLVDVERFVLIGVGLSALWGALTTLLLTRSDPEIGTAVSMWLVGTLNARTWEHALVAGAAITIALIPAWVCVRHLAAMELGTDLATGIGVDLRRVSLTTAGIGVLLTAAGVAATGPISFVSLAAPQLATTLGGRHAIPVLGSALCGAVMLLGAELIVQHLPLNAQLPVGIMASVLGGSYLIFVIFRNAK